MKLYYFLQVFSVILTAACVNNNDSGTAKKTVYANLSIDYKVHFHKGHVRMPISTNKNAIKN